MKEVLLGIIKIGRPLSLVGIMFAQGESAAGVHSIHYPVRGYLHGLSEMATAATRRQRRRPRRRPHRRPHP